MSKCPGCGRVIRNGHRSEGADWHTNCLRAKICKQFEEKKHELVLQELR